MSQEEFQSRNRLREQGGGFYPEETAGDIVQPFRDEAGRHRSGGFPGLERRPTGIPQRPFRCGERKRRRFFTGGQMPAVFATIRQGKVYEI